MQIVSLFIKIVCSYHTTLFFESNDFSCPVDTNLEITAVDAGADVRSPPPLECRPKSDEDDFTGYWDSNIGAEVKISPYANSRGRIDIEGCCYWGRGVLLTRGNCNIGKLNHYLGMGAARDGRKSLYPDIDFCRDPEATCSSSYGEELRWTTSMLEWADTVQRYNNDGWVYEDELFKFVDGGMTNDRFIDDTNRILSRGCHINGCSDLEVRMADERKANFYTIINDVFAIDDIDMPTERPTRRPTAMPLPTTQSPTVYNDVIPGLSTPQPVENIYPTAPQAPLPSMNPTPRITPMPISWIFDSGDTDGKINDNMSNNNAPTSAETLIPLEGSAADSIRVKWSVFRCLTVGMAAFYLWYSL